jgi:hypothetical protein
MVAADARHLDEVTQQRPAYALLSCHAGRVHRLDLPLPWREFGKRGDGEQPVLVPGSEEGDVRRAQPGRVQHIGILPRRHRMCPFDVRR